MVQRTRWRLAPRFHDYKSSSSMDLGEGIVVGDFLPMLFVKVDKVEFEAYTDMKDPVYSSFLRYKDSAPYLEDIEQDWDMFTHFDFDGGPFKYSIFPILYSFTASSIIALGLTVIVFFTISKKPFNGVSRLLKIASLLACANLTTLMARLMTRLRNYHVHQGIVPMNDIMDLLWADTIFTAIDLVTVFILQLCQVQVVMKFYNRIQEKRIISLCGILLAVVSQGLWAIPPFVGTVSNHFMPLYDDKDMDILSPFVYLVRIALAGSYASLVCLQIFVKRSMCFTSPQMLVLTVITIAVVLLQPVFFVADVTNIWINNLSEICNTTCYLASTVLAWEWSNRIALLEGKRQAQSILGRPIYEDEEQDFYLAKYGLRVQTARDVQNRRQSCDSGYIRNGETTIDDLAVSALNISLPTIHVQEGERSDVIAFNKRREWSERVKHAFTVMVYHSDKVFVKGLSNFGSSGRNASYKKQWKKHVRKRLGLDHGRDDVYVYRTKDIEFQSDDESEYKN